MTSAEPCRFKCNYISAKLIGLPLIVYLFALLLVLSDNTLFGLLGSRNTLMYGLLDFILVAIIVIGWINAPLKKRALIVWIVWATVVSTSYFGVYCFTGDGFGLYGLCFAFFLACSPLFLYILSLHDLIVYYAKAYVNVILVLSLSSFCLWIVGPILSLINPNCVISNSWNGTGIPMLTEGYFGLLYNTQDIVIGTHIISRNTGIFAEAPMYSYALSIALVLEVFVIKRSQKWIVFALVITVLSTLSTTGILVVMAIIYIAAFRQSKSFSSRTRMLFLLLLAMVFLVAGSAALMLLDQKLGTASGSIRLDDFVAGYNAWSKSPWFGYGLSDSKTVVGFMSEFRSYNIGFSNSLFDLLVRGGFLAFVPIGMSFILMSIVSNYYRPMFLIFIFLWIVTIVTFQPLTSLYMGAPIFMLMRGKFRENVAYEGN